MPVSIFSPVKINMGHLRVSQVLKLWIYKKKSTKLNVIIYIYNTKEYINKLNEVWLIWLGGGKGYFRHFSKLFYIKGIGIGQQPIFYHF